MSDTGGRRRSWIHITRRRASRLYTLVRLLEERPRAREEILKALEIGLRTFYRELDLLKRCGVRVRHKDRLYALGAEAADPRGRLPFPDPQLSFAEIAELALCDCEAGRRLAALLDSITGQGGRPAPPSRRRTGPDSGRSGGDS
jgi:hypothetical protein